MKQDRKIVRVIEHLKTTGHITSHQRLWLRTINLTVKDTQRGYARFTGFSVPLWAYNKGEYFFTYYVCHEMSHIFTKGWTHDKGFYETFRKICPEELWHFEKFYLKTKYNKYLK